MSDMIQLPKSVVKDIKPAWSVKVVCELPERGESGVLYALTDELDYKVYNWIGRWVEIKDAASDYQLAKHEWDIRFELAWPQIKEILDKGKGWIVEVKEESED